MLPSMSTLKVVAFAILAVAALNRFPQTKALLNG